MRLLILTGPGGPAVTDPDTGEVIAGLLAVEVDLVNAQVRMALSLDAVDLQIRPTAMPVQAPLVGFRPSTCSSE